MSRLKADIQVHRGAEVLFRYGEKCAKDCIMIVNDESDPETKWKKNVNEGKFLIQLKCSADTTGVLVCVWAGSGGDYTFKLRRRVDA